MEKLIKINKPVQIEKPMSLNLMRNRQPSFQLSRVSSSSSSSSQGYMQELIPREQPFFNPKRDVASPRASFPFRKVQAGNESSIGNRSNNQSRNSIKGSVKDQSQSQSNKQREGGNLDFSNHHKTESQKQSIRHFTFQEQSNSSFQQAQKKIENLERILLQQREQFAIERQANEIYIQAFAKIRKLIISNGKDLEGEGVQEMVQKLSQILQRKNIDISGSSQNVYHIIQQQDKKIRQLRAELLKSTQNNINAIFNTQITEAYLLQGQIQRMNTQIISLKQKLIKATADNQESIAKILQNNSNTQQVKKVVKYYKLNWDSESQGEDSISRHQKGHKKSKQKEGRQRSSSQNDRYNIQLLSTQNKVNDLIQGFNDLKDQYSRFGAMLTQISNSQTNFKELFPTMIKDITNVIQTQIKEVKQSSKRPSSSHEQLRIARQMESKLNDLVNMFNSPEKVNIEKSFEDQDHNNWKNAEIIRKLAELQSKNSQLQNQVKQLSHQRDYLLDNINKIYVNKPPIFSDI